MIQSNPSPVTVAFTNSPPASVSKDVSLAKLVYDFTPSSTNGAAKSFPVITASNNQNFLMTNSFTSLPTAYENLGESSSLFDNNNNNSFSLETINPMPTYDDSIGLLGQWQNSNNYPVKIDSVDMMHF